MGSHWQQNRCMQVVQAPMNQLELCFRSDYLGDLINSRNKRLSVGQAVW